MDETKTPNEPQAQPASEVVEKKETSHAHATSGFTPVGQLFKDTWHLMTKKMLKLLLMGVYGVIAWVGLVAILGVIALISGVGAGGVEGLSSAMLNPAFITTLGLSFIVYVIVAMALGVALQAAMILVVAEKDEEKSTFQILKSSFHFVVPLIIASLLTSLLVLGSMFLLVIPAIFVSIMLGFSMYTVLFEKKQGLGALRMSVGIMQQHFGAVVGRFILLFLAYIGVLIVFSMISSVSDEAAALMSVVQMLLGFVINWFFLSYAYLVYKQARAAYDESKKVNMAWIWIVSAIGWVVAVFASVAIVNAIASSSGQFIDAILNEASKSPSNDYDMMYDGDYNYDADTQLDSDFEMSPEFEQMFGEDFQKQLEMEIQRQQQMQDPGAEI